MVPTPKTVTAAPDSLESDDTEINIDDLNGVCAAHNNKTNTTGDGALADNTLSDGGPINISLSAQRPTPRARRSAALSEEQFEKCNDEQMVVTMAQSVEQKGGVDMALDDHLRVAHLKAPKGNVPEIENGIIHIKSGDSERCDGPYPSTSRPTPMCHKKGADAAKYPRRSSVVPNNDSQSKDSFQHRSIPTTNHFNDPSQQRPKQPTKALPSIQRFILIQRSISKTKGVRCNTVPFLRNKFVESLLKTKKNEKACQRAAPKSSKVCKQKGWERYMFI